MTGRTYSLVWGGFIEERDELVAKGQERDEKEVRRARKRNTQLKGGDREGRLIEECIEEKQMTNKKRIKERKRQKDIAENAECFCETVH